MNDVGDAVVAVSNGNDSSCGLHAPVPRHDDSSGGIPEFGGRIETMDVDTTLEDARPRPDAMRAPLGSLMNATVDGCSTQSSMRV